MKDFLTIENNEIELAERSVEIDVRTQATEMREIVHELKDTMRKKGLKFLSAPAIGYKRRIFCIDFEDLEIKTYINPVIAQAKGISISRETPAICPNRTFLMPRSNDIMVMYQTPTGKFEQRQLIGYASYVFQQLMAEIDGTLITDVGLEIGEDFDKATDEEREEVIKYYLDSLDLRQKELDKEIESNPELKEISDGIKFMEGVYKGEIELDKSSE